MEHRDAKAVRPTDVVAQRVRQLRARHGWSAERLAAEMRQVGVPWQRIVVTKLETGKRQGVTIEELLALSYVLDVGVLNLLVPTDDTLDDGDLYYWAVPAQAPSVRAVRAWVRGDAPLGGQDPRFFFSEVPVADYVPPPMTPADIRAESARIRYHRDNRGTASAYETIVAADEVARAAREAEAGDANG